MHTSDPGTSSDEIDGCTPTNSDAVHKDILPLIHKWTARQLKSDKIGFLKVVKCWL